MPRRQNRLCDVWFMTVTLLPVTRCEPPDGHTCPLQQQPTTHLTSMDAKHHAAEHPGHLVIRETVTRTQYHYEPDGPGGA